MVMSLAPPRIVQPTARTRTLNDKNKNGFTDSFNRQRLPPSASLSIVLLASPVRLCRFSSTTPDVGRPPRPPRCNPADGGGDVRGSEEIELQFRFDTIELTFPPPPPRGGGANREAGVAGSPRPKSPARATFDSGSAACPRPEGQRAKSSERRRKEGKRSSTVSARGGYRCARDPVEASHCYDI